MCINKLLYSAYHKIRMLFSNFRSRLIICFMICSIFPFFIIGAISYRTSYRIAQDKILESVSLSDNQLVQQISNRFKQMENVTDSVNNYVYILAVQKSQKNLTEYIDYFGTCRSSITALNSNFGLLHTCIFMPVDSPVRNEGLTFYSINNLSYYKIDKKELTNLGVHTKWLYRNNLKFPVILMPNKQSVNVILCCQSLTLDKHLVYALFTSINSDELSKLLYDSFIDTPITSYICTSQREIVAHRNKKLTGTYISKKDFKEFKRHVNQAPFIMNESKYEINSLNNGYYMITQVPLNYITKNIKSVNKAIFISLTIMIPIMLGVVIFISMNLSKKLRYLTKIVRSTNVNSNNIISSEIDNHFNINYEYGDEIDKLASAYQEMLHTIDRNLASILELSLQEEKLKYQLLQSQINPHFLYNILGTIQTCLTLGKADIADQMILNLVRFYRITLRKNNDIITIRDELEIATLYLEMEQICYRNKFTWNIDCDDGIENFMICKFTLQPFLENCLMHGYDSNEQTISIDIRLRYGDDTIIITISDNGVGISPDKLIQIQNALDKNIINYSKNFGVSNVNARISSPLYGSGHIKIDSMEGKGTTITIEFRQLFYEDMNKKQKV